MTNKTFDKEFMISLLDEGEHEGAKIISNEICEHGRWAVSHRIIFSYEDKFYSANYRIGATECQDEGPWEYVKDVKCIEVKPVEKRVTVYEPVSAL